MYSMGCHGDWPLPFTYIPVHLSPKYMIHSTSALPTDVCDIAIVGVNDKQHWLHLFGCSDERKLPMNVVYNKHVKEPYIIAHVQTDQCVGQGMNNQG